MNNQGKETTQLFKILIIWSCNIKPMKQILGFFLVIAVIGLVLSVGCMGSSPQSPPSTSPGGTGGQQATTIATTAPVNAATTTVSAGRIIIDEKINLKSGYQDTYQTYAFEDYGYQYLYPNDVFRVSINSDKPVNVLIVNKDNEMKFPTVEPEWNTVLKKDQWDYSPLVPTFSQSNVLRKDMAFTIKDKSMYFLIIDPRFASEQAGWRGSKHEPVNIDVKVTRQ
jgi:hypothetical protein